jgi:hypothetical protein
MTARAPPFVAHPSSASEIAALLRVLFDRASFDVVDPDPLREALVRIAARYGEIVTASLNLAPEHHLDELTALLALQGRPAAAASTYLSFSPTARPSVERVASLPVDPVIVRAHTRVAGKADDSGEPPVFETTSDLSLVQVQPERAVYCDAGHRWSRKLRLSDLRPDPPTAPALVPYELHIGHGATFGLGGLRQVIIRLGVRTPPVPVGQSDWIVRSPDGEQPLQVISDATRSLAQSGDVVLAPPPIWPATAIDGVQSRWLTLRFPALESSAGHWRSPRLDALTIRVIAAIEAQPVTTAFQDTIPLDVSKDFLPFGDRPRFGSAFRLISPTFAEPGAKVELRVQLTNPANATDAPVPPVMREGKPSVVWEILTPPGVARAVTVLDGTKGFTQSGSVSFTVPEDIGPAPADGKREVWLRARLASGHYGIIPPAEGAPVPIVLAPVLRSVVVHASIERGPLPAEHLISQGALTKRHLDPLFPVPVDAVPVADVTGPTLYVGLGPLGDPAGTDLRRILAKGQHIAWHVRPHLPAPPLVYEDPVQRADAPQWQMWCDNGWLDMPTRDASDGLTRSGLVRVEVPDHPAGGIGVMLDEPVSKLAWLRIVWPASDGRDLPTALTLNSVEARHLQRLLNEIVGSSAGRPDQVFHALRTPVIGPVRLQVRETEEDWIDWIEVESTKSADNDARAFSLDRKTGTIRFGDGRHGRIPPPGPNNIRLAQYHTGGGHSGNQPAGALAQLRSAVPGVTAVTNMDPATGGLDADNPARVRERGSSWLRHRGRAVGVDDFEDLAKEASPEVARAFCVSARDLTKTTSDATTAREPGIVSVIVIPHATDPAPQPRLDLLASVKTYLDERRPAAGRLVIVGPTYSRVRVRAEIAPADDWSPDEVGTACRDRVRAFLHPVSGGADQCGWAFEQRPHRSDIYSLLDAMECVGFVRSVAITIDTPPGMPVIVAPGEIDVQASGSP